MSTKRHHLHTFNPDWDSAALHGKANQTGIRNLDTSSVDANDQCRCCG